MASKPFEEKQIAKEVEKEKELLKLEKNEKIEKHEKHEKSEKAEKDNPDSKQHKDNKDTPDTKHKHEKEKREKQEKSEKHEKLEHKEQLIEKQQNVETAQMSFAAEPQAAGIQKFTDKLPQAETKFTKEIKLEIKEIKHEKFEKFEIKEHKIEKHEKVEIKEFKVEKLEFEAIGGLTDPGGPVEQRLAALEAAVTQLLHFIPENLRPDLSQGALKQEPDAAKQKPADPKAEPKPKS